MSKRLYRTKKNFCMGISVTLFIWMGNLISFAASAETALSRQEIWNRALPIMIPILALSALAIGGIVLVIFFPQVISGIMMALNRLLKKLIKLLPFKKINEKEIDDVIREAGYAYDPTQDIFYSVLNPWQRKMGYCRLYDEGMAPLGMIADCEPITFDYAGKKWLIEFWKGQYDLCTGFEVGVYNTSEPEIDIPELFTGNFYQAASNTELLYMSCSLKKNGRPQFSRAEKHWWLTGFRVGEFSQPEELSVNISITLKDEWMRDAFIGGLRKAGYAGDELMVRGNTVNLIFDKPHTRQPFTRTKATDWLIQKKNELMCEKYQELTKDLLRMPDKMRLLQHKDRGLYRKASSIGKMYHFADTYEVLRKYTNS